MLLCPVCGNEMTLEHSETYEDIYYNQVGDKLYYTCNHCFTSAVVYTSPKPLDEVE